MDNFMVPIERYFYYLQASTQNVEIASLLIEGLGLFSSKEPGTYEAVEHLKAIWKQHKRLPSLGAIISKIDKNDKNKEDLLSFLTKANHVQLGPFDVEVLKTDLRKYIRNERLLQHFRNVGDKVDSETFDYTELFNEWKVEDAKWNETRNLVQDDIFDPSKIIDAFKDRKVINSDLANLDKIIGGGWEYGGLYTLLGQSNVGKTLICVHLARSFALKGKNVLYLNYEGKDVEIRLRVFASLIGVPVRSMKDNLDEYLPKLSEKPKCFGELRIQDVADDRTVANIEERIQEYKEKLGISFDVVIIDQLSKLSLKAEKKQDTLYTKFDEISMGLKDLATKLNMVFVTPVQATRPAYGKNDIGMDSAADSISIARNCDVMVGIGQSAEDKVSKILRIKAIKSRYIENGGESMIKVDYTLQRLSDATKDDVASAADNLAIKPKAKKMTHADDFKVQI